MERWSSKNEKATANDGWRFTGWVECGANVIANANYSFTAAVSRTLEARFVQRTDDDPPFDNPHDGWAEDELIRAYIEGLFPQLLMAPGVDLRAPITRVEFAGIVIKTYENLSGARLDPAARNPFTDTNAIIRGFDDGTFRPRNITDYETSVGYAVATRQQALIIALRMVESLGN